MVLKSWGVNEVGNGCWRTFDGNERLRKGLVLGVGGDSSQCGHGLTMHQLHEFLCTIKEVPPIKEVARGGAFSLALTKKNWLMYGWLRMVFIIYIFITSFFTICT
jgi:hypothetical protein